VETYEAVGGPWSTLCEDDSAFAAIDVLGGLYPGRFPVHAAVSEDNQGEGHGARYTLKSAIGPRLLTPASHPPPRCFMRRIGLTVVLTVSVFAPPHSGGAVAGEGPACRLPLSRIGWRSWIHRPPAKSARARVRRGAEHRVSGELR